MKYFLILSFCYLLTILFISCEDNSVINTKNKNIQKPIDIVYSFTPGSGQNIGQSDKYYPNNIFGLPDPNSTYLIPCSSETQILSLGMGGEIIVGFKDCYLIDGKGADFTIFENVFYNPVKNICFAEPAKVSVSKDGITYFEFPFDTLTLAGCAGVHPTIGNVSAYNPEISGGDSFDLSNLGIDSIQYIKITDISYIPLYNKKHPFYDITITGFDLDAVVGIYLIKK